MKLPSGRFCLIRDKFVRDDGHLVIRFQLWRDEADYKARPNEPRAEHDGRWAGCAFHKDVMVDRLERCLDADGNGVRSVDRRHKRGGADLHGYLTHPDVLALEVTL